jgi:hypothetical protein
MTPTIIAVRMDSWEGVLEGLGRVDGNFFYFFFKSVTLYYLLLA